MGTSYDTGVSQDRKSAAGCWANMSIHRSGVLTALEEEPGSFLSLVNPVLQQACGSHVCCLVAKRMNLAHVSRQYCVIFAEFSYHVERLNVFSIAVHDALKARNLPDRTNGCPVRSSVRARRWRPSWRKAGRPGHRASIDSPGNTDQTCANGSSWS